MNLKLETEFSKADVLKEVDALKKQIDDMRPLPADVEVRVIQKLRLDWNYNSNAIEGNKLSYGETTALLMHGITAKGKPLKDHLDIQGHNKAIEYLENLIKDERPFTEMDIRTLHEVILVEPYNVDAETKEGLATQKQIQVGKYKSTPNHVKTITGEIHYYSTPEETPAKMNDLMDWYSLSMKNRKIHPIVLAALFHHKFVAIHPFDDGNGRMARILMNLILMQNGYPPVVVKLDDRQNYYALLSQADIGENWPFVEYIIELLRASLQLYIKAINGGDIDEDEDINKEIALFKLQIRDKSTFKEKKSFENIQNTIMSVIDPLADELFKKAEQFDDLFTNSNRSIKLIYKKDLKPEIFSGFNQNMLDFISSRYSNFVKMEIHFSYNNFKSMKSVFNIKVKQTIVFNMYSYDLFSNNNVLITSKKYLDLISNSEKRQIVKILIEDIQEQIKSKLSLKSPKS